MFSKKIRGRRSITALAAVGVAGLALAACTTDGGDTGSETDGEGGGGSVAIAVTNGLTSLNSNTPDTNLNTNGISEHITGTMGGLGSFLYLDGDFQVVHDETNVSYELVSEDPLTVQYSINEGAVWSDGEPITTTDLLLSWGIGSGYWDDAVFDPETGEVTEGAQYFPIAGGTDGLDTTEFPEIDAEAGTMTITYGAPFVDWELVNMLTKPAHVVAEHSDMTLEEFDTLLTEQPAGDPESPAEPNAQLQAAGEFWTTGYNITEMPTDESLLVGVGPYVLSEFTANDGGSAVYELNPNWAGDAPAYDQVILSFIGDTNSQVQALRNGEVDIIYPTSGVTADVVSSLEDGGSTTVLGDALSYDHLDLSFDSEVFSNPTYREAFLLTVPRQAILEALITPLNPEAEVLNSQMFVSSQPQYADAAAANGYADFAEPDIEAATALLDGATPEITILYNSDNPDRVDSFQLIQESAQEAGFIVNDGGSPDWSSELGTGTYDASIFGWISAGAGYAGLPQIWATGGGGNYNAYSNEEVDALVAESQTVIDDQARLDEIQIEIDTLTREDFYGLPLFQSPGLVASSGTVDGLDPYYGGQVGPVYNILDWAPIEG